MQSGVYGVKSALGNYLNHLFQRVGDNVKLSFGARGQQSHSVDRKLLTNMCASP